MFTQLNVQLKLLFRNKTALLAMIVLPLLLTFLLTRTNTGPANYMVYMSDGDQTSASAQLIRLMKNQKNLTIREASPEKIDEVLKSQNTDVAVKIEKGFAESILAGGTPKMQILQSYESARSTVSVQAISQCYKILLETYSGATAAAPKLANKDQTSAVGERILAGALKQDSEKSAISSVPFSVNKTSQTGIDDVTRSFMGFLFLFLGMVVIQGCRTLIEEKENRTYERMLGTPGSFLKFLIVKTVSIFLYGVVHIVVIIAAGRLLFHLDIFRNLLPLCLVFAAYLFALIGIVLAFTLGADNQKTFSSIGLPVSVLTGMLGGCFFPIEIAPGFIQLLSHVTPQGWALPAVASMGAANSSAVIATACGVLTSAGIVFLFLFFFVHSIRLKYRFK